MMNQVKENDYVIIKKMYEDVMRLTRVDKETNFFTGKCKANLMNLIGTEYGSILEFNKKTKEMIPIKLSSEEMYELSTCQSELIPSTNASDSVNFTSSNTNAYENDTKDNRNLNDDGKSQKLSRDVIEGFKDSELTESEIITELVTNSSTFADKSLFSQAKYIKKKRQKYSNYYKLYKPSIRLLVEMNYNQCPSKINFIRIDTLGQMLNAVNVHANGTYIVIDNFVGLLSAAVLDRLVDPNMLNKEKDDLASQDELASKTQNGRQVASNEKHVKTTSFGKVIQIYTDQGPCSSWRSCIESLNFPPSVISKVMRSLQVKSLFHLLHGIEEEPRKEHRKNQIWNEAADDDITDAIPDETGDVNDDNSYQKKKLKLDAETLNKKRKLDEKAKRRLERKDEEKDAKDILKDKLIDGALISIRSVDPTSLMELILPFLAPSASFAVFCINAEPLASCLSSLKGRCVNLKLTETWLRKYQVLPGRTRPDMMMSGSGGYLLTGIKLSPNDVSVSPKKTPTKVTSSLAFQQTLPTEEEQMMTS